MPATKTKTAEAFDFAQIMTPESFKEGFDKAAESLRDATEFQKEAMEAMMTSAGVYAKGVEKAASEHSAFVKESYDDGAAAMKAATSASSVQEALEIQSEFSRSIMEKNLSFVAKLADHWTAVAKEATDPLAKRYGEFVEKVQAYRP
ncbi:MAG: hypothetical protein GC152_05325 [Alphaproteobacteria bacterium]|nr:hypothetical protein [Alphaproteobacteria bacterium]